MTNKIASIVFLLALSLTVAAQSAEKTFSKSFNTDGKGTISLDLPGVIDLKVWDNPTIRIGITVSIPTGSEAMLGELANIGRYNLVATPKGDVLTIQAPNMQKQIRVKGQELRETLTYVVFVPKDLTIDILPNAETVAANRK
ncbi:MAG: hypothetical protein KDC61_22785 [Saprospiraceae bacterium]|nr:hypothetical protein [Saprospiraceae bacterium]MCB0542208.1 hypothetical protein [Saprospiraceae bacterium]MCB0577404.1 hypothetical protein [Saprospiraceae bacterium]MCB9306527.1 hypothetical protein [Lewinellaceae bacterium]MCB9355510.1 hypothetical protein [Lewinellaceae bacterium]